MPGFKIQLQLPGGQRAKVELPLGPATTFSHLRQLIATHAGVESDCQRMRLASSKPGEWLQLPQDGNETIGARIQAQDRLLIESAEVGMKEPVPELRSERPESAATPAKRTKLAAPEHDEVTFCGSNAVVDLCSPKSAADDDSLCMLMSMGFDEALCRRAMEQCGTADAAAEWILLNQMGESSEPASNSTKLQREHHSNEQPQQEPLKFLTWNIWFDPLEQPRRMQAIGDIIQAEAPDFVALQEVTPELFMMLAQHPFVEGYDASRPPTDGAPYFTMILAKRKFVSQKSFLRQSFAGSMQGRDLLQARCDLGFGQKLVVCTSHLESAVPPYKGAALNAQVRKQQLAEANRILRSENNVIFGGDMNWENSGAEGRPMESLDEHEWKDAWEQLKPGKRLDRMFVKLRDFELSSIKMVGTEPIAGATFQKTVRKQLKTLQLLPSDHYGLVLELSTKRTNGNRLQ